MSQKKKCFKPQSKLPNCLTISNVLQVYSNKIMQRIMYLTHVIKSMKKLYFFLKLVDHDHLSLLCTEPHNKAIMEWLVTLPTGDMSVFARVMMIMRYNLNSFKYIMFHYILGSKNFFFKLKQVFDKFQFSRHSVQCT